LIDLETARQLASYNTWADETLFAAMATLPDGAVYKKTNTLFGSMVGTLNHNFQVDLIWQAHLTGRQHSFATRREVLHPRLEELVIAQTDANRWLSDWAQAQDAQSLGEFVEFRFTSGQPARMQRGMMFLHVINHKTYHRGWVSQMFFDVGRKPPETDISVYMTSA
jgi:uncharacterized damage-inducible protein DinB